LISTQHVAGYVKFTTAAGSVSISATHMLVINGAMADPRSAKVGDQLQTPSGPAAITAIEDVKEPGAFHIFVAARDSGYFAAAPGATTFYASGNVLTAEAGRATYDEYDLGTTVGVWFTLEMFQWYVYDKAVSCYALGRPLPSIDEIGWEGVFTTPCANFPVVAGLP